MKKKYFISMLWILVTFMFINSPILLGQLKFPKLPNNGALYEPIPDGSFTDSNEYLFAARKTETIAGDTVCTYYTAQDSGWIYNGVTQPNRTFFVLNDLYGMQLLEDQANYNIVEASVVRPDNTVDTLKVWCFYGDDSADDTWMQHNLELANYGASFDDRGFLVRLNGDSLSDFHWLPGDPEPGDSGWDGDAAHYCFAAGGWNTSAVDYGYRTNQPSPNMVYEWVFMNNISASMIRDSYYECGYVYETKLVVIDPYEPPVPVEVIVDTLYCLLPGPGACCDPSIYSNTTDDWISNVSIGTIDNYTGQEGESSSGDYSDLCLDVYPDSTYELCVTVNIEDNSSRYVSAFFDWDQNCNFTEYQLGIANGPGETTLCMDIQVPSGLNSCDRCVRITEQEGEYPESSSPQSTEKGESEDYCVHVVSDPPCPVTLTNFTAAVIQSELVELFWSCESESDMMGYRVYRSESGMEYSDFTSPIIQAENLSHSHDYTFEDHEIENEKTYNYWLEGVSLDGVTETWGPVTLTIEQEEPDELPEKTMLIGNYPNPFKPVTNIKFNIRKESKAILTIVNTKGQVVERAEFEAGYHNFEWNAENISSGVYFYKLESESYNETKKMILLK